MSEAKRLYNLVRGYVSRELDRIQEWEKSNAQQELGDTIEYAEPARGRPPQSADKVTKIYIPKGSDPKDTARKILGVSGDATFKEIRRAFEKLNKRSQSDVFQPGTVEADQADELRRKVQWAYQQLTADLPDVEKRFRSLEID